MTRFSLTGMDVVFSQLKYIFLPSMKNVKKTFYLATSPARKLTFLLEQVRFASLKVARGAKQTAGKEQVLWQRLLAVFEIQSLWPLITWLASIVEQ